MAEYISPGYDELFAGGGAHPERMTAFIIKAGSGLVERGTVLGVSTQLAETDLYAGTPIGAPVDSTKTDGTQTVYAVLADTVVDATTADARCSVYLDGEFNRDALKFGGTDTVAQHEQALRRIGIITKRIVK